MFAKAFTATSAAQRVKHRAAELGFDACGIAAAEPIDPQNHLGEWIENGYHADMDWMARTKEVRQDVQKKLPGTRSIVVVAKNYYASRPDSPQGRARVARYAWGRDYHRVMEKPLRTLARDMERDSSCETYCCIDSGPVLEKAWAARAGIGWIGKNSLVLRRDLGSYFFLGVILTTADLTADVPVPEQCGNCRLCIEACPTDAIVSARVVDSRRCISYHTIENRGDIPTTVRELMDDWIFGCDICQDVCPWNRRLRETQEVDFQLRPAQCSPDPRELLEINEAEFRARYAGTPLMRAKHAGLQRNAAIAIENAARRDGAGETTASPPPSE